MKTVAAKNHQIQLLHVEKPEDVPKTSLLIRTLYSVISPGTEISALKLSTDRCIYLGYSAVGIVEKCGDHNSGFKEGDLVACYGAPYVRHAEYLLVPHTLCGKVPDHVKPEEAALSGLGAIAIHALRVAELQFGDKAVVAGLGIIGQLIAQIADAAAYEVYAYDLSLKRTEMFCSRPNITCFTDHKKMEEELKKDGYGHGADAVLLCAGGKQSPLTAQSLKWIRDKGKVVIVGDIEPNFPRSDMFAKEAQIRISRAGGPGRYDPKYEREASDYPIGFVRWTEGRNIDEFLRLLKDKRIDVSEYVKEVVHIDQILTAYESLLDKQSSVLTKVIQY
ncbi:zinc-binding alcohol dehydrogenase [Bacillus sp. CMF21]|nr:zinc-binding alcohol dehydrogenase [Bacillus sp. CMF21]